MKKITFLIASLIISASYSQTLLLDNEPAGTTTAVFNAVNPLGPPPTHDATYGVTAGDGETVLEIERLAGGAAWTSVLINNPAGGGVTFNGTDNIVTLRFRTARTTNGIVRFKLVNDAAYQVDVPYTGDGDGTNMGSWQTLAYDFSAAVTASGNVFAGRVDIFVDPGNDPATAFFSQVDTIEFGNSTTLGISDFSNGDISSLVTSDNPVSSSIDLNASGDYSIINFGGSTVQSGSFDGSINVENLSTGIYFLAIEGGVYKFAKN